jgi:integrase/recombinase XerD
MARRNDRERQSLAVADWPALDRALLAAAFQPGDLLDGSGPGARLSPATRRKRAYGYGRWLRFLARQGGLDPALPPAARVTPVHVARYVEALRRTMALSSVRNALEDLTAMLALLQPGTAIPGWLRSMLGRITRLATPVRPVQPRLVPVQQLYAAGLAAMREADAAERAGRSRRCAGAFRDGLAVALLAACPLRRRSCASLRIGRQLLAVGDGFVLQLGPAELKNGTRLVFPLPAELAPWLRRYLGRHRPVLLGPAADAERHPWLTAAGRPLSGGTLAERIGVLTARRLGRPVAMHHFRHAAATGMALHDPHHVRLVAALLGHRTLAASERYYNLATSLEAAGSYQRQLRALHQRLIEEDGPSSSAPAATGRR